MNIRKHLQGPMSDDEYKKVRADLITVLVVVLIIIPFVHIWLD